MSPTKASKKPSQAPTSNVAADKKLPTKRTSNPDVAEAAPTETDVPTDLPLPDVETSGSAREQNSENADPEAQRADARSAAPGKQPSPVQSLALELAQSNDPQSALRHLASLEDDREAPANQAARLVQELSELKPELLVPLIERFARLLVSKNKRVAASAASALPPLSRIAPAKVAKQLPLLTQNWEDTTEDGKDGLVRTFAGLCTASVAYQKRLEPALARALGEAEPKLLIRWTEIVLPALKGEPHARARAVVEERLPNIPRPQAQKIADFLGIKLRPLMR